MEGSREILTPPLDEFIERYRADERVWDTLSDAHRQNLFEEALELIESLTQRRG